MKRLLASLTSTAAAGLLFLVPIAVLFLVAAELWVFLEDFAAMTSARLPFPPVVNALILIFLAALAAFVVCLVIGFFLTFGPGRKVAGFVQSSLAEKIPLLGLVRNLTLNLAGSASELQAVEADVFGNGAKVLGILTEMLSDGRCVVFVPMAPTMTFGQTYILDPDRVRVLGASVSVVAGAVAQWGAGTAAAFSTEDRRPV